MNVTFITMQCDTKCDTQKVIHHEPIYMQRETNLFHLFLRSSTIKIGFTHNSWSDHFYFSISCDCLRDLQNLNSLQSDYFLLYESRFSVRLSPTLFAFEEKVVWSIL